MIEPQLATQDDYEQTKNEMYVRALITPMRYHAINIGSVVVSGAFDRLREEYLKATQSTYVGKCRLCKGDVTTAQQFMRVQPHAVVSKLPFVTHMICEERRQIAEERQENALLLAKVNYQAREIKQLLQGGAFHAVIEGEKQSRNISEHPYRGDSGQTAEASCCNRPVESRKVSPEVFAIEQESARALNQHYNFRVDDIMDGSKPVYETPAPVNNYKWNPKFTYDTGAEKDPPLFDLTYTGKAVQPSCE